MKLSFVLVLVLAFAQFKVSHSKCGCQVVYKPVGCFKDKDNPSERALPNELINERDSTNPAYNGYNIDWLNWDEYLPAFTCRCAEAAKKNGYKYFGLQFWGECWSGPSPAADKEYAKYGSSGKCYGPSYEKCNTRRDENCVGTSVHNFVYEIVPNDQCSVYFERLGCFKDNDFRPMPDYMISERDKSVPAYNKLDIDWWHFDIYLPEFACRCAKKAVLKGYNTFGLQYYGECWGGPYAYDDYFKIGASNKCINKCYGPCKNIYEICVGEQHTNFVYRIVEAGKCELQTTALGCFNNNGAFDELIIDDVEPQSERFMGIYASDPANWEKYIKGLTCRCARKIRELGYTTFGITNEGACFSGSYVSDAYGYEGKSADCYRKVSSTNSSMVSCTSGALCTGNAAMYVHKLSNQ